MRRQLRNRRLLQTTAAGSAFFFTFVGTFSYVVFRLERPPFSFSAAGASIVFALWLLGIFGPALGSLADRIGWRRLAFSAFAVAAVGLALTIPDRLPTLLIGLALSRWRTAGVTAAQLGIADATSIDRGTASAIYYSLYYLTGALGGYLPPRVGALRLARRRLGGLGRARARGLGAWLPRSPPCGLMAYG